MAESDSRWLVLFEDRYGTGAYDQLLALLEQPCVTFAEVANKFGVTRERVRQWHAQLLPGAPRGHARQRLCRIQQQKRRLLGDPLFRSFYQHARPHVSPGRMQLVQARDGFRTRSVRVDDHTVAIRRAGQPESDAGSTAYRLSRYRGPADFVYYSLAGSDYLFLPTSVIPPHGTLFLDEPASKYQRFKNTFDALTLSSSPRAAKVRSTPARDQRPSADR